MLKVIKSTEEFKDATKNGKVLVDFFANWCGPCKMLAPVLEQIANEKSDIDVIKIDVDALPDLASSFGVASIPTLFLVENGTVTNKSVGFMNKTQLEKFIG